MWCFVIGLLCAGAGAASIDQSSREDPKIIVDSNFNLYTTPRNNIKPTSHNVQHAPGVPPGWHNQPHRPITIGNLFSFRQLQLQRESNIIEVTEEYPFATRKKPSTTTEVTVTSDWLDITNTQNLTLEEEYYNSTNEIPDSDAESTNKLNFNLSRPALSPPEPIIFGDNQNGDKNNNVLTWVLNTLGINRPGTAPPTGANHNTPENGNNHKPMRSCKPCQCGENFKQTRIVGGVETQVNAYPWVVYLNYKGNFYCGGSLISDLYVLTAGHCVSFPKDQITVTMLDHDRASTTESKTITRKVVNIYKHKNYNMGGSYNNDIALLKLESPIVFEGRLHPVCLAPIGPNFNEEHGVAVGWGATKEGGHVSNVLREVEVPILSNENCRKSKYGNKITDNMMCAGDVVNGNIDSCQGDSGGPLHVVKEGRNLLVGIVSWGEGCAQKNYPGVYTRVNRYISWIMTNTKDSCYCQSTK